MALGDYNNDNNRKKYYEPILYSPYGTSNTDGVDPSAISYNFYNGMLKISISPMKPGAKPDDRDKWDHDNAVSAWLTHAKALMLYNEIKYTMEHMDEINNAGVSIGAEGLISFSTGKELGASSPCLVIRKIDKNDGSVITSYAYQFKTSHYGSIRNFDPNNPADFERHEYKNLEIEELMNILYDYARSIGGAYAYANMNAQKFDTNRTNTKFSLIMEKLGIENLSGEYSKKSSGYSQSFFSNQKGYQKESDDFMPTPTGNDSSKSMTIDQLDNGDYE